MIAQAEEYSDPYETEDREANMFAIALLMPEDMIGEWWKRYAGKHNGKKRIGAMAHRFGVSYELMLMRLLQLGYRIDLA